MSKLYLFLLLTTCFVQFQGVACFIGWLFREKDIVNEPSSTEDKVPSEIIKSKAKSPFEMQTVDEKFLVESQFIKDLSALDLCHHWVYNVFAKRLFYKYPENVLI